MKKYFYLLASIASLVIGLGCVVYTEDINNTRTTLINILGMALVLASCFLAFGFVTTVLNPNDCQKITEGLGNGTELHK